MLAPRSVRIGLVGLVAPLVLMAGCSGGSDTGSGPAAQDNPSATESTAPAAPDDTEMAAALITKALELIDSGDSTGAKRLFVSVLDLDPSNVYAHYNLGYLAQLDGDNGSALRQYTTALATQPDFAPALYNLAILTEPADLRAAVDLYRRVIDSNGGDPGTYWRLGHALVQLGKGEEGDKLITKAIGLDPSLADTPAPTYR